MCALVQSGEPDAGDLFSVELVVEAVNVPAGAGEETKIGDLMLLGAGHEIGG